jgi:TonB family protein
MFFAVMGRNRAIFPIALALSLALHAVGTMLYIAYGSRLLSADIKPARVPELVVKVDPELMDFGDAKGTGIGNNSSPGEQPLRAREADADQALLSRLPTGFGKQLDAPSPARGNPGSMAMAMAPMPAVSVPQPSATAGAPQPAPKPAERIEAPPPDPAPNLSVPAPAPRVELSRADEDVKPSVTKETPAPAQPQRPTVATAGANRNPGVPTSAGKPLPQSESDSDPFARLSGSVVFHNGRLDQQLGRQVRTVSPQLGIAGELDAIALNSPTLIVEVHIEPSGRVSKVDLVRKSGSVNLDEPTVNAVYQWRFEPARDKAGVAIADVVTFAFGYR